VDGGVARAQRFGDLAPGQVVLAAVGEEGNLAVQQADVNRLSTSGKRPLVEGGQNAVDGEHPAGHIAHRGAHTDGLAAEFPGVAHDAAPCLYDEVEGGAVFKRACFAVAGDGAGNDTGINLLQGIIVYLQSFGNAGAVVIDDDIGFFDQFVKYLPAPVAIQVEDDALFVAVMGNKIGAFPFKHIGGCATTTVAGTGPLDLDNFRAQISQNHGAVGSGDDGGQVKNPYTR
jgi:hypothetical protein